MHVGVCVGVFVLVTEGVGVAVIAAGGLVTDGVGVTVGVGVFVCEGV